MLEIVLGGCGRCTSCDLVTEGLRRLVLGLRDLALPQGSILERNAQGVLEAAEPLGVAVVLLAQSGNLLLRLAALKEHPLDLAGR